MKVRVARLMGVMTVAVGLVGLLVLAFLPPAVAAPPTAGREYAAPPTAGREYAAPLASPATTWRDDFNGPPLHSRWSWIDEDPTHWSLTARPGFLRITTTKLNKNALAQSAPPGNYEIETRVLITPNENFQGAGLGVYLDDQNQLSLIRAFCGFERCVGDGIYFDVTDGGALHNYMLATTIRGEAYLRIVRQGNRYTGYASEDGIEWVVVGAHTVAFAASQIGLRAGNSLQDVAEIPADFDYFTLVDRSQRVYLPLTFRNY